jgi:hypothetical protein
MSGYGLPSRDRLLKMPRELVEASFTEWSPPSRRITMEDILGVRVEAPAVLLNGMAVPPLDNWSCRAVEKRLDALIEPAPMREAA